MSLLNLKKSKPLAKPALRSVDAFIDDAILYAQGKHDSISTVPNNANSQISELDNRVVPLRKPKQAKGMRHATFTLTPECIDKLTVLSDETGSSRSALIRQWIQESYKRRCGFIVLLYSAMVRASALTYHSRASKPLD